MAKISIEEALRTKLALPWKVIEGMSTVFLVMRRRPEDLTAEIYTRLRDHGLRDNDIRELFYGMPGVWSKMKSDLGITTPKGPAPKEKPVDATISPAPQSQYLEFGGKQAGKTSRLSQTPAGKLPKIVVVSNPASQTIEMMAKNAAMGITLDPQLAEQRVNEIKNDKIEACINGTGPMPGPNFATEVAVQAVAEQIAKGVRENVEAFLASTEESADSKAVDFSGWDEYGDSHVDKSKVLVVGKSKIYIGAKVTKLFDGWSRCKIKVRPDCKQIAVIKSDHGVKLSHDDNRINISCAAAISNLIGKVGAGAEFVPITEQESLVVFAMWKVQ